MVQGRQEAEFELESACGSQGLHQAAGGAAGGQGGRRGVQLRGRGPEGVLPPGRHRSVLEEGAELARVQVMRGLGSSLTRRVCAYLELLSLHISPSSMFHTDTHVGLGGMTGEGVPGEGELSLSVCLHSVRLGCSVLAYALSLPIVPSVQTRLSLIIWD